MRTRRGPLGWFIRGGWYPFFIAPSLGLLTVVPFTHAALRLRRPVAWLWVALYGGAEVTLLSLSSTENSSGFALVFGTLVIGGTVHTLVLRRHVWPSNADVQPAPAAPDPAKPPADPAVAAQIVNARAAGITFMTVDDVFSCTDIPYPLWDRIRDRAVVING